MGRTYHVPEVYSNKLREVKVGNITQMYYREFYGLLGG
jgi:hypothetical protein